MIFDNEKAEALLQKIRSDGLAEDIAVLHEMARPLIEVIAHSVCSSRFEDLVQEGHLKLQNVVSQDKFESGRGKLYSFLSVVIRHSMLDVINRDRDLVLVEDFLCGDLEDASVLYESINKDAVVRYLSARYMNMYDDSVLRDIVSYVVDACVEGVCEGQRGIVRTMISEYGICRGEANALYISAVVAIRMEMLYVDWTDNIDAAVEIAKMSKFLWTSIPDLALILGMDIALVLTIIFRGVYVKF